MITKEEALLIYQYNQEFTQQYDQLTKLKDLITKKITPRWHIGVLPLVMFAFCIFLHPKTETFAVFVYVSVCVLGSIIFGDKSIIIKPVLLGRREIRSVYWSGLISTAYHAILYPFFSSFTIFLVNVILLLGLVIFVWLTYRYIVGQMKKIDDLRMIPTFALGCLVGSAISLTQQQKDHDPEIMIPQVN